MNLFAHLVLRLVGVVALCLALAVAWVMADTRRAIEAQTALSADRVARALETLYWRELLWHGGRLGPRDLRPRPEWETLATMKVISPGVCVTFAPAGETPRRLCSQVETVGHEAPAWFAATYGQIFGSFTPAVRPLTLRRPDASTILAEVDPGAAVRQAWDQIRLMASVATLLALGIGVLAALTIGHSLRPARTIAAGLRRLENGDYRDRLPDHGTAEFRHIARAVNDLAGRLAETTAQRVALTNRLFQVQEEERRALARDLHDEFGQCLAGIGALAAAVEAGSAPGQADLVEDARSIAGIARRMRATLRSALARLRSQDVEELGLEASLAQLVAGWNVQTAPRAVFQLDVGGDLSGLPNAVAIHVYRIAQECLTNAARHGRPSDVRLHVARLDLDGAGAVALSVEDDGGGSLPSLDGAFAGTLEGASGYGLLGIRERVAALGGRVSIAQAERGVRVAAVIPLMRAHDRPAADAVPA
ncbi:ATP-binding protein [Azospirillum sp.]|uniref:ATP-binding protein n=1 Tax=Azospirillum sp. TaxID=34012 RepID=UPI003D71FD72